MSSSGGGRLSRPKEIAALIDKAAKERNSGDRAEKQCFAKGLDGTARGVKNCAPSKE